MSGFTERQRQYNDALKFRMNSLLTDLFLSMNSGDDWQAALEKKLDRGLMLVGVATAAVTVAVIAAPVTSGGSLVTAGVVLGAAGHAL